MVREYKGSHSGEHGDGLVRSEFHEAMFGSRIVRAFEEVKDTFDPAGPLQPRQDRARRRRWTTAASSASSRATGQLPLDTALDWSEWGGFAGAVEMCNNNGACRKSDPGVMCPSYRATGDEQHLTRGRANTLRLALSGQLGPDALASEAMRETMALCVSCKGCKRECPTGVDMARMKIEFLHQYRKTPRAHAARPADRLSAALCAAAPRASRRCSICATACPALARLGERLLGLQRAAQAAALVSRSPIAARVAGRASGREVVLLRRHLQPLFRAGERARRRARAAPRRLSRDRRPSRRAAGRSAAAAPFSPPAWSTRRGTRRGACSTRSRPIVAAGTPIVGLEPSCLLDPARRVPGAAARRRDQGARRARPAVRGIRRRASARPAASSCRSRRCRARPRCCTAIATRRPSAPSAPPSTALQLIPGLDGRDLRFDLLRHGRRVRLRGRALRHVAARSASSACCRRCARAAPDTLLAASGTSCRHQIADGAGREALHIARILDEATAE